MDEIANNQQPKITGLLKSTIVLAVIVTIMSLIIFSSVTHELLLPGIYYLLYLFLIIVFFTLSILSLYTIIKKNSGLKGTAAVWLSMLVVLLFFFLAYLSSRGTRIHPPYNRCTTNLRSLGIALELYQYENDGKYPSEYKWCDLLKEYDIEKEFICPADKIAGERCSYAMNPYCKPNSPPDIVLLFESKPGWNRSGGKRLLNPDKHYKRNWLWGYKTPGCYILFNDKHVEFVYAKDFNDLKWK